MRKEINGFSVELKPFAAYDFLTNLRLFMRDGQDTISTGVLNEEEMNKALKIIFSESIAYNSQGEEFRFVSPGSFQKVFKSSFKELMECLSLILEASGINDTRTSQ